MVQADERHVYRRRRREACARRRGRGRRGVTGCRRRGVDGRGRAAGGCRRGLRRRRVARGSGLRRRRLVRRRLGFAVVVRGFGRSLGGGGGRAGVRRRPVSWLSSTRRSRRRRRRSERARRRPQRRRSCGSEPRRTAAMTGSLRIADAYGERSAVASHPRFARRWPRTTTELHLTSAPWSAIVGVCRRAGVGSNERREFGVETVGLLQHRRPSPDRKGESHDCVCQPVNDVGEPCAGEPDAWFDAAAGGNQRPVGPARAVRPRKPRADPTTQPCRDPTGSLPSREGKQPPRRRGSCRRRAPTRAAFSQTAATDDEQQRSRSPDCCSAHITRARTRLERRREAGDSGPGRTVASIG